MKNKYILISTLFILSNISFAQETLQPTSDSSSSIFLSEEVVVPLPISNSNISFNISASGKTAKESNSGIESTKKKLETILTGSPMTIVNRRFSGGSGSGEKLSGSTPILIEEQILVSVSEALINTAIDSLLAIPQVKITGITPMKDNLYDLKTQMSSKAVKLALQKAATIAKDQSMILGDIVDLNVTEEPTPDSIREQLEPGKIGTLSSLSEIKIIASVRVKLKRK